MRKVVKKQGFRIFLRLSMYVMQITAVAIILKYSGLANGIADTTQSIVMKSGLKDIALPDHPIATPEKFDFDFNVKTLDGNVIKMSEMEGNVIFLNLWATWCGPCRAEMPAIQSLYEKVNKENIQFVILSIDNPDQQKRIRNYVKSQNFTFPIYVPSGFLPKQLSVPSIPTTFVVNKDGKIVVKKVGMTNFDTPKFKAYLEKLAN
jgi:thiol-disulfide isomerase/thioredoxin